MFLVMDGFASVGLLAASWFRTRVSWFGEPWVFTCRAIQLMSEQPSSKARPSAHTWVATEQHEQPSGGTKQTLVHYAAYATQGIEPWVFLRRNTATPASARYFTVTSITFPSVPIMI